MATLGTMESALTETFGKYWNESFTLYLTFSIPLFVVIYYMYSSSNTKSGILGFFFTFLITGILVLCRCENENENATNGPFVKLIAILIFSIVSSYLASNVSKNPKYKNFFVNSLIQYSLFVNLYLIILHKKSE